MLNGAVRAATAQEHDYGACQDDCLECEVHRAQDKLRQSCRDHAAVTQEVSRIAARGTRLGERIKEERDSCRDSQKVPRSIVLTAEGLQALPKPDWMIEAERKSQEKKT